MNYNRGFCRSQQNDAVNGISARPPFSRRYIPDHDILNGRMAPLSAVYAPIQVWRNIFDDETALKYGTLFAELNLPFAGYKQMRNGGCSCER